MDICSQRVRRLLLVLKGAMEEMLEWVAKRSLIMLLSTSSRWEFSFSERVSLISQHRFRGKLLLMLWVLKVEKLDQLMNQRARLLGSLRSRLILTASRKSVMCKICLVPNSNWINRWHQSIAITNSKIKIISIPREIWNPELVSTKKLLMITRQW